MKHTLRKVIILSSHPDACAHTCSITNTSRKRYVPNLSNSNFYLFFERKNSLPF